MLIIPLKRQLIIYQNKYICQSHVSTTGDADHSYSIHNQQQLGIHYGGGMPRGCARFAEI